MSELNVKEREAMEAAMTAKIVVYPNHVLESIWRDGYQDAWVAAKAYYTRDDRLSEVESKICLLLGTHNIACAPELIKILQDKLKREQEMFQALADEKESS